MFWAFAIGAGVAAQVGTTVATIVEGEKQKDETIKNKQEEDVAGGYVSIAKVWGEGPGAIST